MNGTIERIVAELDLLPHPEGGYYRETYRSAATVTVAGGQQRRALTNIYFLLTGETFSAWHRIDADETWHFYRGDDLVIAIINEEGALDERRLGANGPWQTTVPAGCYFSAYVPETRGYALVGCSVAPGFEFSGFDLAPRSRLIAEYPQHRSIIERFTRD